LKVPISFFRLSPERPVAADIPDSIALLLYTGMRGCDVSDLKLTDIDWIKNTIKFRQGKTLYVSKQHNETSEQLCISAPTRYVTFF